LLLVFIAVISSAVNGDTCFPMTRSWGSGPNGMPLENWWCGADSIYGFLGFSLPLEDDCNAYSYNGFVAQFKDMKNRYGATFVRAYLPVCRQTSFWVNLVKAARDTSLGLIPMIFWDFGQNDPIMKQAEDAFMGVFNNSEVGSDAPYVIHSVAFGDEVGEEGDYWVSRMKTFKGKLSKYSVPVSITDDWDRNVYKRGSGLSDFGNQTDALDDLTQAHVMPFYHPDQCVDAFHFWDYFLQQLHFMANNNMKRPIFVSQTLWAYNKDGHQRGNHDEADNMQNYMQYWNTINDNCQTFKDLNIGWFFHSYTGEPGLDLIGGNGRPVFNFQIKKC